MAEIANLVTATTTTTGTGAFAITASFGQTFADPFGVGVTEDVFYYHAFHETVSGEWECGTGHMSTTSTLVRDTVIDSSNGGALVDFSAGTKRITNALPATVLAGLDSWAAVSRAAGFDTFAATPSSANLRSLLTDETGTGSAMFGTSPSVTTDIRPASNGGASIGIAGTAFSDAFLTSSSVIDWGGVTQLNADAVEVHKALTCRQANKLINSSLYISQERGTGSSGALSSGDYYSADQWRYYWNLSAGTIHTQNIRPPGLAGYPAYSGFQVDSAATIAAGSYAVIRQDLEGKRVYDLRFGTSVAKGLKLAFWVYATKTGTYSVCVQNAAGNRSYVATYTVNASNTWELKTITIAGDTAGTWVGDSTAAAMFIAWTAAIGSIYQTGTTNAWQANGAFASTSQVNGLDATGNQFWVTGAIAVPDDCELPHADYMYLTMKPYAEEMIDCLRYYRNLAYFIVNGYATGAGIYAYATTSIHPPMRVAPTVASTGITYSNANSYSFYNTQIDTVSALCASVAAGAFFGYASNALSARM